MKCVCVWGRWERWCMYIYVYICFSSLGTWTIVAASYTALLELCIRVIFDVFLYAVMQHTFSETFLVSAFCFLHSTASPYTTLERFLPHWTLCSVPFPDPKMWYRAPSPSNSEVLAQISATPFWGYFLTWCDFFCKTVNSLTTRTKLHKNIHSFLTNQFTF